LRYRNWRLLTSYAPARMLLCTAILVQERRIAPSASESRLALPDTTSYMLLCPDCWFISKNVNHNAGFPGCRKASKNTTWPYWMSVAISPSTKLEPNYSSTIYHSELVLSQLSSQPILASTNGIKSLQTKSSQLLLLIV